MTINLNLLVAGAGCAALLLLGLIYRRGGLRTFIFVATGCVLIVAAYHSDKRLPTLAGIFVAGVVICAILTTIHMLVLIQRRRVHVYRPRRSPRPATRLVRK